jgi:hypothetical protein
MKNTKLNFYWIYIESNGNIRKAIFETIIEGRPFESMDDAKYWEETETDILLSVYGPHNGNIILDRIVTKYNNTTKPVKEIYLKKLMPGRIVFTDLEAQNRRLKRQLEKIKEPKKLPEPKIEQKQYTSCWIDPSGKQYDMYGVAQHNEFASEILETRYKMTLEDFVDDNRYPYEILQDMGWIRILGWTNPPTFVLPKTLTVKSKRAVKDYCLYEKISFPERLKW